MEPQEKLLDLTENSLEEKSVINIRTDGIDNISIVSEFIGWWL